MSEGITAPPDERLAALVPALLRLSFQLTGDPEAGADIVAAAVATGGRGAWPAYDADHRLASAVARAARRRAFVPTGTVLDDLGPGERAAVVLAFGWEWGPATIAEVRRTTQRRVRRDVAAGLAIQDEEEWRRLLSAPRWRLPAPPDLLATAQAHAQVRRRHRRRTLLALGSAATAVAGLLVTVERVANGPPAAPATAHVAGLLPWPARGPLARDAALVAAATAAWRAGPDAPRGEAFVLYAGRVDGQRLVVLQGLGATGPAAVAVVVAPGGGLPRPAVRSVTPLAGTETPAVVVTTSPGVPSRTRADLSWQRLLLAPGAGGLSERPPTAATPDARPGFVSRGVADGLSEPWPAVVGQAATAVRLTRADGSTYRGILLDGWAQPVEVRATAQPPPRRWLGLPRALPIDMLTDDVLWWAQACRRPDPVVRPVWVGGAPAFPARVRMELVSCPGVGHAAVFLTGSAEGSVLLNSHRGTADAYATEFPGLPAFGLGTLLVVGSARVATIRVGSRSITGRVVRLPLRESGPVRAFDPTGRRLVVR